jgi:hypothetical protein
MIIGGTLIFLTGTCSKFSMYKTTIYYPPLDHTRSKHILDKMKVIPVTEYVNYRQN